MTTSIFERRGKRTPKNRLRLPTCHPAFHRRWFLSFRSRELLCEKSRGLWVQASCVCHWWVSSYQVVPALLCVWLAGPEPSLESGFHLIPGQLPIRSASGSTAINWWIHPIAERRPRMSGSQRESQMVGRRGFELRVSDRSSDEKEKGRAAVREYPLSHGEEDAVIPSFAWIFIQWRKMESNKLLIQDNYIIILNHNMGKTL